MKETKTGGLHTELLSYGCTCSLSVWVKLIEGLVLLIQKAFKPFSPFYSPFQYVYHSGHVFFFQEFTIITAISNHTYPDYRPVAEE